MHRFGNLIALPPGINSKAGTKPFVDKLVVYKSVAGLHHVTEITKLKNWNLFAIEKREKNLIQFAHEQWW